MKLAVDIKSKEQAEEVIQQLQEFINQNNKLYPNIEKGKMFYIINNDEEICGLNYNSWIDVFHKQDLANIYKTREITERALKFKKSRRIWNFIENWIIHNATYIGNENSKDTLFTVSYNHAFKFWYVSYNGREYDCGCIFISEKDAEQLVEILNSSDEYKL